MSKRKRLTLKEKKALRVQGICWKCRINPVSGKEIICPRCEGKYPIKMGLKNEAA